VTSGLPVVAIVGRPNVGKSALFNRLVRARRAIVDDVPGVTRDRVVATATHAGRRFLCVDTGGFIAEPSRGGPSLEASVREQALVAVRQAACVVCVLDGPAGLLAEDRELLRLLRRSGKPVLVAVNKLDTAGREALRGDFYGGGFGEPMGVSAAHGRGVEALLDAIVATLPPAAEEVGAGAGATRVALIGRPNVGKSSLLNRLLGEERVLVAPEAGTTRDAIDTPIDVGGRPYVLIDTAGIRRRGRVRAAPERHGAVRALGTLARADLVLVVLDATEGMTDQDARLVGRAWEAGRGCILLANKWDLVPREHADPAAFRSKLVGAHPAFAGLPLLCVSARTGEGLDGLWRVVARVERAYRATLATAAVNQALAAAREAHPPPSPRGRALRLLYATQTGRQPPTLTIFASAPADVSEAYRRYLAGRFVEAFRLDGVPLRLVFRGRRETEAARPRARRGRAGAPRGRRSHARAPAR
jgi:GTP-binding protein